MQSIHARNNSHSFSPTTIRSTSAAAAAGISLSILLRTCITIVDCCFCAISTHIQMHSLSLSAAAAASKYIDFYTLDTCVRACLLCLTPETTASVAESPTSTRSETWQQSMTARVVWKCHHQCVDNASDMTRCQMMPIHLPVHGRHCLIWSSWPSPQAQAVQFRFFIGLRTLCDRAALNQPRTTTTVA
jgi:hypothetical protein